MSAGRERDMVHGAKGAPQDTNEGLRRRGSRRGGCQRVHGAFVDRFAEAAGKSPLTPRMLPALFLSVAAIAALTTPEILDRVLIRGVGHVGEFGASASSAPACAAIVDHCVVGLEEEAIEITSIDAR